MWRAWQVGIDVVEVPLEVLAPQSLAEVDPRRNVTGVHLASTWVHVVEEFYVVVHPDLKGQIWLEVQGPSLSCPGFGNFIRATLAFNSSLEFMVFPSERCDTMKT